MNFGSGSKKSVMTKTVFIVLYKKEGGLNGIVHTFEKEATTAQNRASGNRVTDSTGNAFMGGHPNPTPPPQRESKKCTVHFNTTRLLFCE